MNALVTPAVVPTIEAPSLRLFASVPRDFIAHAQPNDNCAPLLRKGEIAIVTDQYFLYPESGGWYLVEFSNGKNHLQRERPRSRSIMLVSSRVRKSTGGTEWWVREPHPMAGGIPYMSDGPYDFNHLAERILGRVVGIYAPDRVQENPTDQEQWQMLRPETPWPYETPMLPSVRDRRRAA